VDCKRKKSLHYWDYSRPVTLRVVPLGRSVKVAVNNNYLG